jgi:hypothetical protein
VIKLARPYDESAQKIEGQQVKIPADIQEKPNILHPIMVAYEQNQNNSRIIE